MPARASHLINLKYGWIWEIWWIEIELRIFEWIRFPGSPRFSLLPACLLSPPPLISSPPFPLLYQSPTFPGGND